MRDFEQDQNELLNNNEPLKPDTDSGTKQTDSLDPDASSEEIKPEQTDSEDDSLSNTTFSYDNGNHNGYGYSDPMEPSVSKTGKTKKRKLSCKAFK